MPTRPDLDEPTATFYCEDCGDEFDVEGTLIVLNDGTYEFEPAAGMSGTVYCPSDDNDGDNDLHEVSLITDGRQG